MTSTIQVPLNPDLAESLREIADKQGQSLENVLDDLVRQYVRQARREKIRHECRHYERIHPTLKQNYAGQHVAIHEGQLVDHDVDPMGLVQRIRERYGRIPVLVTRVSEEPFPEFSIRRPRLVQSQ